jgi:uncharacterized Zn finger protein
MICPVCKQAEMQEVPESSPLNTTYKCLNCGAEVVTARSDDADDKKGFKAVFARQPDGTMQEIHISE